MRTYNKPPFITAFPDGQRTVIGTAAAIKMELTHKSVIDAVMIDGVWHIFKSDGCGYTTTQTNEGNVKTMVCASKTLTEILTADSDVPVCYRVGKAIQHDGKTCWPLNFSHYRKIKSDATAATV